MLVFIILLQSWDIFFWSTLICINPSYYLSKCHVLRGSITLFLYQDGAIVCDFFFPSLVLTFWWNTKRGRKTMVSKTLMMVSSCFLIFIKFCLSSKRGRLLGFLTIIICLSICFDERQKDIYIFIMLILINYLE